MHSVLKDCSQRNAKQSPFRKYRGTSRCFRGSHSREMLIPLLPIVMKQHPKKTRLFKFSEVWHDVLLAGIWPRVLSLVKLKSKPKFCQLYSYRGTDRTRNSLIAVVSLLLVNFKLLSIYCKAWFAKPSYLALLSEVLCKIAVQCKVWAMFQSRIRCTQLLAWNRFLVQKLLFPQLFNTFSEFNPTFHDHVHKSIS